MVRLFEVQRPTLNVDGTFLCHLLVAAEMKGREKKEKKRKEEAAFCLLFALTVADKSIRLVTVTFPQ